MARSKYEELITQLQEAGSRNRILQILADDHGIELARRTSYRAIDRRICILLGGTDSLSPHRIAMGVGEDVRTTRRRCKVLARVGKLEYNETLNEFVLTEIGKSWAEKMKNIDPELDNDDNDTDDEDDDTDEDE